MRNSFQNILSEKKTYCFFCTDSSGKNKILYKTREAAINQAELTGAKDNIILKIYPCPRQSGWHLTKGL